MKKVSSIKIGKNIQKMTTKLQIMLKIWYNDITLCYGITINRFL